MQIWVNPLFRFRRPCRVDVWIQASPIMPPTRRVGVWIQALLIMPPTRRVAFGSGYFLFPDFGTRRTISPIVEKYRKRGGRNTASCGGRAGRFAGLPNN